MSETISPRQLARAIGASESSVKRWCDRGVLPFARTAGGHRRLSLPDVMQFLQSRPRLTLVRPEELGLPAGVTAGARCLFQHGGLFTAALQQGDLRLCQRLSADLRLAGHETAVILDEVIAKSMNAIGDLWYEGEVDIYQERRGCEIVTRVLHEFEHWLAPVPDGAPVALGCSAEGDSYGLPTRMVELVLRSEGWNAISLGAGVPLASLSTAVRRHRPRLVWVSISHLENEEAFLAAYGQLWQVAQTLGVAVAVGGAALTDPLRRRMVFTTYGDSLQQLVHFVQQLARGLASSSRPPEPSASP